jgi:hypothetical protein
VNVRICISGATEHEEIELVDSRRSLLRNRLTFSSANRFHQAISPSPDTARRRARERAFRTALQR